MWADVHFVETGVVWFLLDLAFDRLDETLFPCLLRRPFEVLVHVMDTLQVRLFNIDLLRGFAVDFHKQFFCKQVHVHFLSEVDFGEGLLVRNVEGVRQVLEPHEDLVLAQWEQSISAVVVESLTQLLREREQFLILLVGNLLLERSLVIEGEVILRRLLDVQLLLSLQGLSLLRIEDLHEVGGFDSDTLAVAVGLVDSGLGAVLVRHQYAPVLHQLDG